ncbi:MAG: hypothetical protein NTU88_07315, partial [Armatimonadetes bacterium]|nr:hypothetical protein [Armatimonadota bacterium]
VGVIKRENTFFDPVTIDSAAVSELNQILTLLQFNPFYPVGVKSVTVNVDMVPKHQTAKLDRIFLKEGKFKPGDTVEVGAVLKPFKGEKLTKTIKLVLPKNTPNGKMTIEVFGGAMSRAMPAPDEQGPGIGPAITASSSGSSSIENLQQMIKKFLERNKNNELVTRIVLPKSVPSIGGEKFIGLPPSISDAMKSSKNSMQGLERDEIKVVTPADWVIFGSQRLTITVQKTDKVEKKTGAKKTSEPSSPSSDTGSESAPADETSSDESGSDPAMVESYSAAWQAESLVTPPAPVANPELKPAEIQPASEDDSAKTEEKQPEATPSGKDKTTGTNEKPVGRAAATWKQTTRTDFLGGTFKNTTATTGDLLMLAGSLKPLCDSGEIYVWCVQPDGKGGIYAGTGNHGIIYKVAADGTSSVLYDSPELEIQSLRTDSAGNVYAGTAPNGVIYKIAPDGKASVLFDAGEKYITALALDGKGNLYAATGDKCKVYKISPDGKAETVLDSSEYHALSLAVDKDDNVYVGTGQNGIIYKITPVGGASVLYDAEEDAVTALGIDSKGALYAGTSPKGVIYKLAPGATPKAIYDKADKAILGICADDLGNVYAVNAANVFKITPDEKVCTLGNERDLQFLSIAIGDGRLYAGTGNVGSVYTAEIGKAIEGTYESPVHDCGLPSKWGTVSWTADIADGTSTELQTRTGNDAEPDSTWSDWSGQYAASGATVISPPGRYVQYRVTLKTSSPAASPKVKDISIVYLPRNQAPKLTLTDPKGGEKWAGKKTIKWTATDPDKDNLSYEVFYSNDSGATWKPLGDKVQKPTPEKPKKETKPAPAPEESAPAEETTEVSADDPEQMLADIAAELDRHPEIPQEVKDKILEESAAGSGAQQDASADETSSESSKPSESDKKTPGNGTKQTSFSWDTSKSKDGSYFVKVVGSDRLSNPVDAMTSEAVSEAVVVCNKAPRVSAFKKTITVQADKSVRFEGYASQETVGIAGVQYRIGTDDWASAAATDGIFDSSFEYFTVTTQPLTKGDYTIEVKAIDQAGNSVMTKVSAKVE